MADCRRSRGSPGQLTKPDKTWCADFPASSSQSHQIAVNAESTVCRLLLVTYTLVPVSAKSAKAEASDVSSSSGLFQATLDIVPSIQPPQRTSCPSASPGPSSRHPSSSADATVVTNTKAPALRRKREPLPWHCTIPRDRGSCPYDRSHGRLRPIRATCRRAGLWTWRDHTNRQGQGCCHAEKRDEAHKCESVADPIARPRSDRS